MSRSTAGNRIDMSSLQVFTRKFFLVNPHVTFTVHKSALDGKVIIHSDDEAVRAIIQRVILGL